MTLSSNDPIWWPVISVARRVSYFTVATSAVLIYDWALTLGQEFELIWRRRWSLMTALYLSVRYAGISLIIATMLITSLPVSVTDADCTISEYISDWTTIIVNAMLGVIIITRLHAMYQRSRKMLVFLSVTFLVIQITCVVMAAIRGSLVSAEEVDLSGIHVCGFEFEGNVMPMIETTWILGFAWEILALSLALWIATKHFHEMQRPSTGWAVGDCFTILLQAHVFYFASFVVISSLHLIDFSPKILNSTSIAAEIFSDFVPIAQAVQMFVLGPRLILSIRDHQAKLVTNSDEGTAMTTIAFQERVQVLSGEGV